MNIKNILENENIETILENEMMASIEPVAITSGGFRALVLKYKMKIKKANRSNKTIIKSGKLHVTMEIGKRGIYWQIRRGRVRFKFNIRRQLPILFKY